MLLSPRFKEWDSTTYSTFTLIYQLFDKFRGLGDTEHNLRQLY